MEQLIEINKSKLTALELQLLAYVAGECAGVLTTGEGVEVETLREPLDQLVLSGFLERDCDHSGWMNTWRVPKDMWPVLEPHIDMIHSVIDGIAEA